MKTILKKEKLLLILLIFVQIISICYWGNQKQGYFTDEFFSFEGAHFSGKKMIYWAKDESFYGNFYTNQDFMERLIVGDENRVTFENIKASLTGERSIYYTLLNIVNSLGNGTLSKWPGIILNIFIFVLSQIFLYKIMCKLGNKRNALLTCFVTGFSAGIISTVIYIRFYMIITFLVILLTYTIFSYVDTEHIGHQIGYLLSSIVILYFAYLIQSIMLFYGAGINLALILFMILKKQWKKLGILIAVYSTGLMGILVLKPNLFKSVWSSLNYYFEFDHIKALNYKAFLVNFYSMFHKISEALFGNVILGIVIIAVCIVGFISIIVKEKQNFFDKKMEKLLLCLIATIFYFALMSQLINYSSLSIWRYVSIIYVPVIILVFAILGLIFYNNRNRCLITALILVFINVITWKTNIQELYPEVKEAKEFVTEHYSDIKGLFFDYQYGGMNWLYDSAYLWPKEAVVYVDTFLSLKESTVYEPLQEEEKVLLWLTVDYNHEELLEVLFDKWKFRTMSKVYEIGHLTLYEINR